MATHILEGGGGGGGGGQGSEGGGAGIVVAGIVGGCIGDGCLHLRRGRSIETRSLLLMTRTIGLEKLKRLKRASMATQKIRVIFVTKRQKMRMTKMRWMTKTRWMPK